MEELKRNLIVACICGFVFGFAWWMMIDIAALYPQVSSHKHGLLYLPILFSTVSLLINALVPNSSLVDTYPVTKVIVVHRLVFFFSMSLGFSGLLSAVIICTIRSAAALPMYGLVGIPLLNALILLSNLAFKFGMVDENDDFI